MKEKAKRYDEAIEKAVKIHNEQKAQSFNVMLKVFPELAEPEDERIRKEILSFLKEGKPHYCPNSAKRQEWAAWLEQKSALQWKPSDEQVEALDNARHSNPFNVHVFDTLFHDLKKLREE